MGGSDSTLAVMAFTSPFRLVFRDENDRWNATLEEVNKRTYDYVKLHRLSASLDLDPDPCWMYLSMDGSLLLPMMENYWPVEKAVSTFNRLLGYIVMGGVYFEPVDPTDIDKACLYRTGYYRPVGLSSSYLAQVRMSLQGRIASPLHGILLHEPPHIFVRDIWNAYRMGKELCAKVGTLSPELVIRGISKYVSNDWASSLAHTWILTEQLIEHLWDEYVVEGASGSKNPIPRRREFLLDHRTWTASTRIELLFQRGIIPDSTYCLLSLARKARNELNHSGILPVREEAEAGVDGVFNLIAIAVHDPRIDRFSEMLRNFKELDPVQRLYAPPKSFPINDAKDSIWLGPLPPIPGEEQWDGREYEKVFAREELSPVDKCK